MAAIKAQLEKIDKLSFRERIILQLAFLIILFIVWYSFFHEPLMIEKKRLEAELQSKQADVTALSSQIAQLKQKLQQRQDPNVANRHKREQLKEEILEVKANIKNSTANLIPPESMPEILRVILTKTRGLTLVKLHGLGQTPLVEKADAEADEKIIEIDEEAGAINAAYKHGMRIEFEGDFMKTLEYMRNLEGLEWGFFWDSIDFKVKQYPDSVSSITLYTMSLNKDWIGI